MKQNQPFILVLLCVLVVGGIELFYSLHQHPIQFEDFDGDIVAYSDSSSLSDNGGNSFVAIDSISDEGLFYRYKLDDQFSYYYAGVQLLFRETNHLDLTKYSHVKLNLTTLRSSSVRFFILTDEPEHSLPKDPTTWRHLRHVIPLRQGTDTYSLDLVQFHTPQWWFETFNTSEPLLRHNPLVEVRGIKVESGEGEPIDTDEMIHLKSIVFYRPVPSLFRTLQGALAIIALLLLLFRFGIMKRVQLGKYKPIVLGNLFDEELDSITDYLGDNYSDSELSLNSVADACAMHQEKVSALIRQGYGQTFKQYLNRLRLTEAQRLLRSTDRQISEIAFAVGYSSVSHFNRVFKQFFTCTPREYRS